jgi:hypothetical protein
MREASVGLIKELLAQGWRVQRNELKGFALRKMQTRQFKKGADAIASAPFLLS